MGGRRNMWNPSIVLVFVYSIAWVPLLVTGYCSPTDDISVVMIVSRLWVVWGGVGGGQTHRQTGDRANSQGRAMLSGHVTYSGLNLAWADHSSAHNIHRICYDNSILIKNKVSRSPSLCFYWKFANNYNGWVLYVSPQLFFGVHDYRVSGAVLAELQ